MDSIGSVIFASSTASILTRILTHPLDTLRINMQANDSVPFAKMFRRLLNNKLFYRGFIISTCLSAPATASYLATYELVRYHSSSSLPYLLNVSVSAAAAEIISGTIWTPMEMLKANLMVSKSQTSTVALIGRIYSLDGIRGFMRGYLLTLAVFVPYSIAYFQTFEYLGQSNRKEGSITKSFTADLLNSALAGTVACVVSHPLEVLKTRWQVKMDKKNRNLVKFTRELIRKEGMKVFVGGLGARILWLLPSVSISMALFQELKQIVNLNS